ncbi:helix-turn-helix domain-containing protein [Nocardia asteroides]|uniref:helix-turn-helix domain-containing protein n=1 Tax=Nocardia asteroides TaxID=1824 RepID=UPI00379B213F
MISNQDPGGRRHRATVTSILTRRYVDEWSASCVARELGCSRSTVSRIVRTPNASVRTAVTIVRTSTRP